MTVSEADRTISDNDRTKCPIWVFYDGDCGLCHRTVLFALNHDTDGSRFRFAPLGKKRFLNELDETARKKLPDSIVVLDSNHRIFIKSSAVIIILRQIGGAWSALGATINLVPTVIRDWAYDRVATVRKRLFSSPKSVCPLISADLQSRFDLD